ncbi:heterocyst development glycosyltransferase HepC [Tumidithrix elongata RA019]|uniref:Heterocyst development glycosyltransferase HepC n=1 Tax=Tumidithrix elongata BACA0141 TaxID=2716417 RepID=A0AAW9PRA2_9CYAN|nr:heterocyst development glycosyltransferase HepC [Tumidithrix elongata RA019]
MEDVNSLIGSAKPAYLFHGTQSVVPSLSFTWRQKKLLIGLSSEDKGIEQSDDDSRLQACLNNSPVKLVLIDTSTGESQVKRIADMCFLAEKPLFLRLPSTLELPQRRNPVNWAIKRGLDWIVAFLLLAIFSPLLLFLTLLGKKESLESTSIFEYHWRVGERGQLFRIVKFCTSNRHWLHNYHLDNLPQLLNVLRGEMSLVGSHPRSLDEALCICKGENRRLNALPGLIYACPVKASSIDLNMDEVNQCELDYLQNWSLWKDFKILCMALPKLLSRSKVR